MNRDRGATTSASVYRGVSALRGGHAVKGKTEDLKSTTEIYRAHHRELQITE
jgi:hypothetical protein